MKDYAALCGAVSREVGVQLNIEGRYRWIVFLPSKTHPHVPVLNRYYGVFDSGKIKTRGIEVRKSDTPKFIYDAQMDMIEVLAKARNSVEFRERIPEALNVLRRHAEKLMTRKVCINDLLIAKRLSLNPSKYTHDVLQAISAKILVKEGIEVSAGQTVQYLITNAESKSPFRRVLPAQFVKANISYDASKYLDLLLYSAQNILSPFGYTVKNLYALLHKQNQELL